MCKRILTSVPTHAACAIALLLRRVTETGMSRRDHANHQPRVTTQEYSPLCSSQTNPPKKTIRNDHGQGQSQSRHEESSIFEQAIRVPERSKDSKHTGASKFGGKNFPSDKLKSFYQSINRRSLVKL